VVFEAEEDDYQTGRLWLDASLHRFVPRRGLTAEYQVAEGHGPRVAIFVFELDEVAQATTIRDDAIRAFVCAPDAEPWSPTDDLIGGRSDQILGEAILTQVDGARVVFFVAGAGMESAATRDAAALRSAQEVLG
jgi:hypothetical protein